jgi:hypothetical protein
VNLVFYHVTFATRAQANAFAAQERQRYPVEVYETDLIVGPRTDRPFTAGVPDSLQDLPGASHQWAVDGSRLRNPKGV